MLTLVRHLLRPALAAAALALAACASGPTAQTRSAALEAPGDGALVLRLLPNNDGTNLYLKQWGSLRLARVDAGGTRTEFLVPPTLDAAARSATYVASLPPGQYRFVTLPGHQCGYICQPSWITPNERFSGFQIIPGRITDLGTLVQGQMSAGAGSVLMAIEAKPTHAQTPELVRELAPPLVPLLQQPFASWDLNASSQALALIGEVVLRSSRGVTAPSETAEAGRFIHGSANGAVISVLPGGTRKTHDVGERSGVETVLVASDGSWYAGGEFSLLKQSTDQGATWKSLRGNLPLGLVVHLLEDDGRVLAAVLRGPRLQVLAAPLGSSEWKPLFAADLNVSRFWDAVNVRPALFVDGPRLVVSLPGQQLAVFDKATAQLSVRALPGSIQYVSVGKDGIYRCRCGSVKVDPYESRDQGRTWQAVDTSRYFMLPAFRDARFAVRLQSAFAGPTRMAATRDGGATWTEGTPEVPHDLAWFVYSRDGKSIWGMTLTGVFWVSRNEGQTWETVKSTRR